MAENGTESGFLVLADISGYTAFLTETELEHGPAVVKDLLNAVIAAIVPPFEVEGLEGDCVFVLGRDEAVGKASYLVDVLEGAYVAFRAHQRQMTLGTTCTCAACKSIPRLNLKILAHHGTFVRQTLGNRTQVAGPDVITAHRLLKNSVEGTPAYLLVTRAAFERTGVDPSAYNCAAHEESYEHVGAVPCLLKDLEPVWQEAAAEEVIRVNESEQMALADVLLPVQPAIAWDWICTPPEAPRVRAGDPGHE